MPTAAAPAPPTPDPLVDALVQSAFMIMAVLNRVGAEHDLSLTQVRVLAILRDRTVTMSALATHLGLEKSTITGLVARAEQRGLLRRAPNERDGRAVDVSISADGAGLVDSAYRHVVDTLAPLTGLLGAGDRRRLRGLLEQLTLPAATPAARRADLVTGT